MSLVLADGASVAGGEIGGVMGKYHGGYVSPRRVKRTAASELTLVRQILAVGLPCPFEEHRFCERKFRFDLAWPDRKLACEIDGAVWTNGRHSRGAGIQRDCEKFSLAAIHGWREWMFCSKQ